MGIDIAVDFKLKMATELISLGVIFLCAIVGGIIAARFKQPAVFGLLLVGALIGPSSLNLVKDANMIKWGAEIGAILMLFVIGLEFDVSKLMKVGARSVLIGLLKFAIVLFFGYQATLLLGFSAKIALFVGVILSFSSTVVVVKVLEQKEMFSRKEVPLLIAVLIIEDILAVFVLTFFSGVKDSSSSILSTFEHIIFSIAILVFAYLVMLKILKYIVHAIRKNNSDESVLTFLSLGMGALFSYFAAYLGLTPSAGAFLAGESLGGRIAIIAAAIDPHINGVLVISTAGFGFEGGPDKTKNAFLNSIDADHYIRLLAPRKLAMMHSADDKIVPLSSAVKTFSKAEEPKQFILINDTDCGHGYCDAMGKGLVDALDYLVDIRSRTIVTVPERK